MRPHHTHSQQVTLSYTSKKNSYFLCFWEHILLLYGRIFYTYVSAFFFIAVVVGKLRRWKICNNHKIIIIARLLYSMLLRTLFLGAYHLNNPSNYTLHIMDSLKPSYFSLHFLRFWCFLQYRFMNDKTFPESKEF